MAGNAALYRVSLLLCCGGSCPGLCRRFPGSPLFLTHYFLRLAAILFRAVRWRHFRRQGGGGACYRGY
ncbi:hypothetical protein GDO81_004984 [Engystomops pustulosus]|uniref:Secreted protein n=1 Tax=Engystomops pustulosus TaxID=76066 RepID=A0AAV7CJW7_ENGPU|nr:hypothetical protein GDO81_004984 [Engystomops pustulosus]